MPRCLLKLNVLFTLANSVAKANNKPETIDFTDVTLAILIRDSAKIRAIFINDRWMTFSHHKKPNHSIRACWQNPVKTNHNNLLNRPKRHTNI